MVVTGGHGRGKIVVAARAVEAVGTETGIQGRIGSKMSTTTKAEGNSST